MKSLVVFYLVLSLSLFAEIKMDLWEEWDRSNPQSSLTIDYNRWDYFLKKYVAKKDGRNLVNYKGVTDDDKEVLRSYIEYLESVKVTSLRRIEQKAYWINLYNALTIHIILENYPVKSIKSIRLSGPFIPGPWRKKLLNIEGHKVSLNDIEHRILRPIWKDRRIHYALNCASIGCPPIEDRAYTTTNIDSLLDSSEIGFINSKFGVDFKKETIILSSIYRWFRSDFGDSETEVLNYIQSLLNSEKQERFMEFRDKIEFKYNWSLNDF